MYEQEQKQPDVRPGRQVQSVPRSPAVMRMSMSPFDNRGGAEPMQCCSPFAVERGSRQKLNQTGIPSQMKAQFENSSGFSFDDVRVHYNSDKPAKVQALAYTHGNEVYMGPGQEQHLGHELGHVVQQKAGMVRATTTIGGLPVNDDPEMEKQADRIGRPAVQMKRGPVVQRLRLRLNDVAANTAKMNELRKVNVSASANIAVSNTPASDKLQKHYTPAIEGAAVGDRIHAPFQDQFSEYGPKGAANTLGVNEDIIFEGHGSDVGMEDYTPKKMAKIAAEIILTCGYDIINTWNGRLVLLGCQTGRFTQETAEELNKKVKFSVTVIGTKKNIRTKSDGHGGFNAVEDWAPEENDAPTNIQDILNYFDFIEKIFNYTDDKIIPIYKEIDQRLTNANYSSANLTVRFLFNTAISKYSGKIQTLRHGFGTINRPPQPQPNQILLPGSTTSISDVSDLNATFTDMKTNLNTLNTAIDNYSSSHKQNNDFQTLNNDFNTCYGNIVPNFNTFMNAFTPFQDAKSHQIDFSNNTDIEIFTEV